MPTHEASVRGLGAWAKYHKGVTMAYYGPFLVTCKQLRETLIGHLCRLGGALAYQSTNIDPGPFLLRGSSL